MQRQRYLGCAAFIRNYCCARPFQIVKRMQSFHVEAIGECDACMHYILYKLSIVV